MSRPPMSITAATGTDAATGVTTVGTTTTGVAGTTGAVGTTGTTGTAGIKPHLIPKPSRAIKSHYANKYDLHFVQKKKTTFELISALISNNLCKFY